MDELIFRFSGPLKFLAFPFEGAENNDEKKLDQNTNYIVLNTNLKCIFVKFDV